MIRANVINELVQAIVQVADPAKIILFGSNAKGDATDESDVDLFIVKESALPRHQRARQIRRAIRGRFPFPKDIVVYTPAEMNEWSDVPQSFTFQVLSTGKTVYEKS